MPRSLLCVCVFHIDNVAARENAGTDSVMARAGEISARVYDMVDRFGGSISAEHGIGILKREALAARKPVDLAVMRAIKQALDPKGIMNPRVLF